MLQLCIKIGFGWTVSSVAVYLLLYPRIKSIYISRYRRNTKWHAKRR